MTTDRDTLAALLERLESSKEPSRRLDDDLLAVLCPGSQTDQGYRADWAVGLLTNGGCAGWVARPFTGSLDAAVALCEKALPGCYWRLTSFCQATVKPDGDRFYDAKSPKPALALVIAMVRAKLAQMEAAE